MSHKAVRLNTAKNVNSATGGGSLEFSTTRLSNPNGSMNKRLICLKIEICGGSIICDSELGKAEMPGKLIVATAWDPDGSKIVSFESVVSWLMALMLSTV